MEFQNIIKMFLKLLIKYFHSTLDFMWLSLTLQLLLKQLPGQLCTSRVAVLILRWSNDLFLQLCPKYLELRKLSKKDRREWRLKGQGREISSMKVEPQGILRKFRTNTWRIKKKERNKTKGSCRRNRRGDNKEIRNLRLCLKSTSKSNNKVSRKRQRKKYSKNDERKKKRERDRSTNKILRKKLNNFPKKEKKRRHRRNKKEKREKSKKSKIIKSWKRISRGRRKWSTITKKRNKEKKRKEGRSKGMSRKKNSSKKRLGKKREEKKRRCLLRSSS